ncbi:ABC transporter permease [Actinomycetospora cinnamomea]|uniref:ABC transporter permease n=1 Tax=Actinomycetospora cinnamomea TaxID=663609 RepID=UPI0014040811|nr:iron ABC transporter permease [Actinomycetospora cinnamomea]
MLTALAVAGPLVALPLSFLAGDDGVDRIALALLPGALGRSVLLGVGVAIGTLVVGGGLAVLVSFWDFPGRRWLDWALVLPLAMPGYVLVFVLVGQLGYANPLQSSLFGAGLDVPGLRGPAGAIAVLTAVLYPYVYVLGRSAFLGQSRQSMEAARSLGRSHGQAVRSVALPLARPALAAGAALAVMEALADFGAVSLLGYQALTDAIYRLWFGAFDRAAALQLATVLVGLALLMVVVERLLRGRARYHQALARGDTVTPRRLRGARAAVATAVPCLLLAVVFAVPVAQLLAWSVETVLADRVGAGLAEAALNTLLLGLAAAFLAVITSTVIVYGQRVAPSRLGTAAARLASVGYAVPGTVIAVAIYVPLVWVDRRLIDLAQGTFGTTLGLVFTGTALGLLLAYLVRFHAQAFFAVDARMGRVHPDLDDAARSLGADRGRVLAEVHLPLLLPGLLTAALLVMVEVMKELPATALLRPLGGDTLAIMAWEATKDSRFDTAALPSLLIVAVGLVPVLLLIRLWGRSGPAAATGRVPPG